MATALLILDCCTTLELVQVYLYLLLLLQHSGCEACSFVVCECFRLRSVFSLPLALALLCHGLACRYLSTGLGALPLVRAGAPVRNTASCRLATIATSDPLGIAAVVMLMGMKLVQQQQGQPGLPGPSLLLIKLVATLYEQHLREQPGLPGPSVTLVKLMVAMRL